MTRKYQKVSGVSINDTKNNTQTQILNDTAVLSALKRVRSRGKINLYGLIVEVAKELSISTPKALPIVLDWMKRNKPSEPTTILIDIIQRGGSREDQVKEYQKRTGRERADFYRKLREINPELKDNTDHLLKIVADIIERGGSRKSQEKEYHKRTGRERADFYRKLTLYTNNTTITTTKVKHG